MTGATWVRVAAGVDDHQLRVQAAAEPRPGPSPRSAPWRAGAVGEQDLDQGAGAGRVAAGAAGRVPVAPGARR